MTDLLDYDDHYATLMDGIRYATAVALKPRNWPQRRL